MTSNVSLQLEEELDFTQSKLTHERATRELQEKINADHLLQKLNMGSVPQGSGSGTDPVSHLSCVSLSVLSVCYFLFLSLICAYQFHFLSVVGVYHFNFLSMAGVFHFLLVASVDHFVLVTGVYHFHFMSVAGVYFFHFLLVAGV